MLEKTFVFEGFNCAITRVNTVVYNEHRCGYICLPPTHKYYGKDYNDMDIHCDNDCGLNYSRFDSEFPVNTGDKKAYWIGFSCDSHSCDDTTDIWTKRMVEKEIRSIVYQLLGKKMQRPRMHNGVNVLERFKCKGFDCAVVYFPELKAVMGEEPCEENRSYMNGYVRIPSFHKCYRKNPQDIPVNCHCGLSYGKIHEYYPVHSEYDAYWIGFSTIDSDEVTEKWSLERMKNELETIILQLIKIDPRATSELRTKIKLKEPEDRYYDEDEMKYFQPGVSNDRYEGCPDLIEDHTMRTDAYEGLKFGNRDKTMERVLSKKGFAVNWSTLDAVLEHFFYGYTKGYCPENIDFDDRHEFDQEDKKYILQMQRFSKWENIEFFDSRYDMSKTEGWLCGYLYNPKETEDSPLCVLLTKEKGHTDCCIVLPEFRLSKGKNKKLHQE